MKSAFLAGLRFFAAAAVLQGGAASAYTLKKTEAGMPVRWASMPVRYGISSAGARDLTADEVARAAGSAFGTWSHVEGTQIQVKYDGLTDAAVGYHPGQENQNVVSFSRDAWPFDSDPLAITLTAYQERSGKLLDADIIVNEENYAWGLGPSAENDLANALTHEVGHLMGLGHSEAVEATMYAQAEPFELKKRDLDTDDVDALRLLYPKPDATGITAEGSLAAAQAAPGDVTGNVPQAPEIRIRTGCSTAPTEGAGGMAWFAAGLAALLYRPRARRLAWASALLVGFVGAQARATILPALTLEDLAVRATDIVEGDVVDLSAHWTGGFIVTDVTVEVTACHKGACDTDAVVVQTIGGRLDGVVQEISGAARYLPGESVLLFLEPATGPVGLGRLRTAGMALGKFHVALAGSLPVVDRLTEGLNLVGQARVVAGTENQMPLTALRARIAELLAP